MDGFNKEYMVKNMYSGILSDVLDEIGYRNQTIGRKYKPLKDETVIFGPAFTSIATVVYSMPEDPLTAQCKIVDQLGEDEIYVLATRGDYNCAVFGELFATAVLARKGAGVLLDGLARDIKQIKEMDFPLFYVGSDPRTSKGRTEINEHQIPVVIDGVTINPGDIIFGDIDGVVVVPKNIAREVFEKGIEIIEKEDKVREGLLEGKSLESVYKEIGAI